MEDANHIMEEFSKNRESFFSHWANTFRNIKSYRFFINQLIKINIQTEFKKSFIGLAWLFIVPILAVVMWVLLNGAGVVDPGDTGIPYPAYVLLSTSIWGFFAEIYKTTSNILKANGRVLLMNKFPYEVLIAEKIIVHFIRFSIPFFVNILVLIFFDVSFTWLALLFPLTLIPLLFMGAAIGLLVALLRIVAIDISNLVDEFIRILMFMTPIVYAPKLSMGWLSEIVRLNPLTYLIGFSRDVLTKGTFYEIEIYFIVAAVALLFFLFSLSIFKIASPKVIERLINN